jgi:hypothetical protein
VSGIEDQVLLVLDADEIHRRLGPRVLEGVPCWAEVHYSDSMDAKIRVDGRLEEARDISTGVLRGPG